MRILTVAFSAALLMVMVALAAGGTSAAPQAWPTPPPGPSGPAPILIPSSRLVPPPPPTQAGGVVVVVNPILIGNVPHIPPLPRIIVRSAESDPAQQVEVTIEGGTVPVTFQLKYEPADIRTLPPVSPSWQVLRAFRVEVYDYQGQPGRLTLARPLQLRIPTPSDLSSSSDTLASQILVARFDDVAERWEPLLTAVKRDGAVAVRLVQTGLFALVVEPPPVPAP